MSNNISSASEDRVSDAEGAAGEWLIWSADHQAYWRANRCGYTGDIEQAGRYSFDEASAICKGGGNPRAWSTHDGPWEIMTPAPAAPSQGDTVTKNADETKG